MLADEINRTPPKTQAALLEAMQERQVTVDGESHPLPDPFLVLATQNPIEYEGTYPLPEAQRDRFLVHVAIGYPARGAGARDAAARPPRRRADGARRRRGRSPSAEDLLAARAEVDATEVTTRSSATSSRSSAAPASCPRVHLGASPRAAVHLLAAAKAAARLAGRAYVTPGRRRPRWPRPVLRHRLVLTPEAELERATPGGAIRAALEDVPVPR